jgi:hypothetical protein
MATGNRHRLDFYNQKSLKLKRTPLSTFASNPQTKKIKSEKKKQWVSERNKRVVKKLVWTYCV